MTSSSLSLSPSLSLSLSPQETPPARLAGRRCVIAGIGGAIGGAIADRFAAEGATVIGIDRRSVATSAALVVADLANEDAAREAFAGIQQTYGSIDVLYVNAGPIEPDDHSLLNTSSQTWQRAYASIVAPTLHCCQFGVPLIDQARGGSVILTGSFLAGMGSATAQMAFNAAKAAVTQLGQDLGIHLSRSNIRVNTIALGPVQTPEIDEMFERIGEAQKQRRLRLMPMARFASLDEVAAAAVYLASDDSGYMTASTLRVDGGIQGAYTIPE